MVGIRAGGMAIEGPYRPSCSFQTVHERSDSSVSSLDEEELQAFERKTGGWWWQRGPATSCCCCFSLRVGMWLLSASALLSGLMNLYKLRFHAWITQPTIEDEKEKYDQICMGGVRIKSCEELSRDIAHLEGLIDWAAKHERFYHLLGVFLVVFSFAGMRAAYNGSSKMAKNFMMLYYFLFVVDIAEATMLPSIKPTVTRVSMCVNLLLCVYYSKVVWSFYIRCKIAEARRRSSEFASNHHIISAV